MVSEEYPEKPRLKVDVLTGVADIEPISRLYIFLVTTTM
jgi:hypothetical protein